MTESEVQALLNDATKTISDDIVWRESEDHAPWVEFRAEVTSTTGWPLFVKGSFNPLIPALSFAMILKTEGRIYALDLGKDHHNPQCDQVGRLHKHSWTTQFRDKEAYVPTDITASVHEVAEVWNQFCEEANLQHSGTMLQPAPAPTDLFI